MRKGQSLPSSGPGTVLAWCCCAHPSASAGINTHQVHPALNLLGYAQPKYPPSSPVWRRPCALPTPLPLAVPRADIPSAVLSLLLCHNPCCPVPAAVPSPSAVLPPAPEPASLMSPPLPPQDVNIGLFESHIRGGLPVAALGPGGTREMPALPPSLHAHAATAAVSPSTVLRWLVLMRS